MTSISGQPGRSTFSSASTTTTCFSCSCFASLSSRLQDLNVRLTLADENRSVSGFVQYGPLQEKHLVYVYQYGTSTYLCDVDEGIIRVVQPGDSRHCYIRLLSPDSLPARSSSQCAICGHPLLARSCFLVPRSTHRAAIIPSSRALAATAILPVTALSGGAYISARSQRTRCTRSASPGQGCVDFSFYVRRNRIGSDTSSSRVRELFVQRTYHRRTAFTLRSSCS